MTERDRLKKLINEAFIKSDDNHGMPNTNQVADYLVANGVVVLPCKVGDALYTFSYGKVIEGEVLKIEYSCEAENYSKFIREKITLFGKDIGEIRIDFCDLGNMFFLTREEAEKALEEMRKEDEGK